MNAYIQMPQAKLIEKMSNEEYHARPEFSSSQLKDMLRSSAHFYSKNIIKEVERETKKHLDFGTLAHTLFLEPEQFHNEFVVIPADAPKPPTDVMRNAKKPSEDSLARIEWWDKFAAEQGTKTTITEDLLEGAQRIANNLRSLSSYKDMQNNYGMAEASIFFTDPTYGLKLRIRPDYHIAPCSAFPNGWIFDVKTANDARPFKFARSCADFFYDLSASMYREGFQQFYQTKDKPGFTFLVAESSIPFPCKQYKASDLFLAVGDSRYNKAKEQLAESLLINEWDGYSTDLEEIFLPSYLTKQALENEFN